MSQDTSFSKTVNKLFFDINVCNQSGSLLDSFFAVPLLRHDENVIRQMSLNVIMEMESKKAWSSRHEFTFTESPLPGLQIQKGTIVLLLGETKKKNKILDLNWQLEFADKTSATNYFDKLKQMFGEMATAKRFDHDEDDGEIAQVSTGNPADSGVNVITLFFGKSRITNYYEIFLVFATEFMDE